MSETLSKTFIAAAAKKELRPWPAKVGFGRGGLGLGSVAEARHLALRCLTASADVLPAGGAAGSPLLAHLEDHRDHLHERGIRGVVRRVMRGVVNERW